MKKRMFVLFAALLLLAGVGITADFHPYRPHTKTVSCEPNGLVLSITTFDGKSESQPFVKCLGHTWLSLENRTDRAVWLKDIAIAPEETLTFSVWAISDHWGVVFNLEPQFIAEYGRYIGRQSLSVNISPEQLATVAAYIDENDAWSFARNCSCWSIRLWNALVPEDCRLPTQTVLYTPSRLRKALSGFDCTTENKPFDCTNGIFFFQNGTRTELTLCS